jgi:hypothetical protein
MNYAYTQPVYGSSYPPSNGFVSPQHGQIRPRVVFDGGNRFVKWIDPNNVVQCLLSVVKEVSEYQWKRLKPDDQSVLIEIDGKRFVIGRLAQELGGEPTFQTDKCQLASILALAAIQPNPGQTSVHIQQMIVALPNTLNDDDVVAVKRIANHPLTKEFKRNGEYITYTVGEVVPVDETEPAFHYALNQGFFSFPEAKNAIWDLGGGTAIARIYTPNGTMIHDAEVILPGTKALAQQVAVEMKEVYSLDYSPSLQGIMDAISRGDCLYGTDKLDFSSIFEKACDQWVESARREIRSKWAQHLPELGEVLIVGGSADIAAPICATSGDRFKIAPSPQLFNIIAMAYQE